MTADKPPRSTAARQARIVRAVSEFIRSRGIFSPGERVIVGVSGGADSTALALLLSKTEISGEPLGPTLTLAHFDHQLRSRAEAKAERAFVEQLAGRLELPIVHGSGDVRTYARQHRRSLEDAARVHRYEFLQAQAERLAATAVAVGHTADDQAETVLLHLIRGAGLGGLRGMPPRSPWPFGQGPALVRPLLTLSRAQTEQYCRDAGIEPVVDPTNLKTEAVRNRVRHEVLPAMRRINPRVREALTRLADSVETDVDYLDREAEAAWEVQAVEAQGDVCFSRSEFRALHPAIASRLVVKAADRLAGTAGTPSYTHLEKLQDLLRADRPRWSISLAAGLRLVADPDSIRVTTRGGEGARQPLPHTALAVPGATTVGEWRFETTGEAPGVAAAARASNEQRFDIQRLQGEVFMRSRRNGDALRPLGLGGRKKLQDILVDAKVPAAARDSVPLVCDEAGILWVVGHCIDERAAVTESTRAVLRVTAEPLTGGPDSR